MTDTAPKKPPMPRRGGSYWLEEGKLVRAPAPGPRPAKTAPAPEKGRARKETDQ